MNTEEQIKELVQDIMQSGFDVAMGGDMYQTEEENKQLQEAEYNKTIEVSAKKIQTLITQSRNQLIDEIIEYLDYLEDNQPEVCKTDNWRNWKYIRNSIRDKYLQKKEQE